MTEQIAYDAGRAQGHTDMAKAILDQMAIIDHRLDYIEVQSPTGDDYNALGGHIYEAIRATCGLDCKAYLMKVTDELIREHDKEKERNELANFISDAVADQYSSTVTADGVLRVLGGDGVYYKVEVTKA
jgi:replicative DNA helicase